MVQDHRLGRGVLQTVETTDCAKGLIFLFWNNLDFCILNFSFGVILFPLFLSWILTFFFIKLCDTYIFCHDTGALWRRHKELWRLPGDRLGDRQEGLRSTAGHVWRLLRTIFFGGIPKKSDSLYLKFVTSLFNRYLNIVFWSRNAEKGQTCWSESLLTKRYIGWSM